jgi:integrase
MGDVSKGRDPAGERKAAALQAKRQALTFGTLIEHWEKLHLAGKRPNYATATLRRVFAKHLAAPAAALDRAIVVRVLDDLAKDDRGAMAGATKRYGSALFGWAVKRGAVASNPFERVPTAPTVRRDRLLTDDEIRRIWHKTAGPGSFNSIVRAKVLCGQRREEVAGMTWAELAPDLSSWTIAASRSKNGKAHIVPLSDPMRELLGARLRREGEALVFPGDRGVFSGWSKAKQRLDEDSAVTGWTLHDIRRTVATGLQRLGARLEVTEAVLNHMSGTRGGLTGLYQRHDFAAEKRAALNAWAAHVAALVEGREVRDNVMAIRARTA